MSPDVLRWPVAGAFLRWRHSRTSFQLLILTVAAIVIAHGLFGPQTATTNLAPVLTWVHFRGLLIVALLAAGNLFCFGCPFVLVRDVGRRIVPPRLRLPRRLRTKWFGVMLFVAVLFVYELFDLWALPRATAYLVIGYFAAALAIDLVFSGATFCKFLCPVGQFNFVASTISPLELRVREESTCRSCRTADCIKGRSYSRPPAAEFNLPAVSVVSGFPPPPKAPARLADQPPPRLRRSADPSAKAEAGFAREGASRTRDEDAKPGRPGTKRESQSPKQRGCELGLFLPMKVGNLDCTFCLDCVHACPHDNIALAARLPAAELSDARRRSGIGSLARRWDVAALIVVFVFGALLNAFAMVSPVYRLELWLTRATGATSEAPILALIFVLTLVVAPLILVGGAAQATQTMLGAKSFGRTAIDYVHALVPFGFGMWLAHYGFHLLTGALTVVPITQSAAIDWFGSPVLGEPWWRSVGLRPGTVFPIQLGCILLGTIGSLVVAHRISEREHAESAGLATAPWAFVIVTLATAAVWILWQPMEMRGTGFLG